MRIMFLHQSPEDPGADPAVHERRQGILRGYTSPGTELDLCYPDDFPGAAVFERMGENNALTGLHHSLQTPALIAKAVWGQESGYDAVVQSNSFDPGVEASRLAVTIPMIGVLRTSLHVAANLATRIGLIVPLAGHVPYTWRIVRAYGLEQSIVGIESIGLYGSDLVTRREEIIERTVELGRVLVADAGAESIIPLGGALFPYAVDPAELAEHIPAPVLNSKSIGIRFAEMCVDLGLTQSPVAYPPAGLSSDLFGRKAFS